MKERRELNMKILSQLARSYGYPILIIKALPGQLSVLDKRQLFVRNHAKINVAEIQGGRGGRISEKLFDVLRASGSIKLLGRRIYRMSGVSDKARFYLEQGVPQLQEFEQKKIFTKVRAFTETSPIAYFFDKLWSVFK